jgi:UDPglucose--hexose-1-phosphate uridylyltransferase
MSEFRKDPIIGRWVVFSPERKQRPAEIALPALKDTGFDPFLEGNEHLTPREVYAYRPSSAVANGPGWKVRVVPNRFPALRIEGDLAPQAAGFYDTMNGLGAHEVIIETPNPKLPLEELAVEQIAEVLKAWRTRMQDLIKDIRFRYLLVFKNVGPLAGATLAHAHSQLMAMPIIPPVVLEKVTAAERYYQAKERNLFEDVLRQEIKDGSRIVYDNSAFTAWCPFASRFPFEVCILPKRQSPHFYQTDDSELIALAEALKDVLLRLSVALDRPSYNFVLHTAPIRRPSFEPHNTVEYDFRWHIDILPRLAGIAGFEFGTGFYINTTLPEEAAAFLRQVNLKRGRA